MPRVVAVVDPDKRKAKTIADVQWKLGYVKPYIGEMALADVFDALISRRVYKEPFSADRASAIIMEGRGSHFDPDVVDAFAATRERFLEIAARFADTEESLIAKMATMPWSGGETAP